MCTPFLTQAMGSPPSPLPLQNAPHVVGASMLADAKAPEEPTHQNEWAAFLVLLPGLLLLLFRPWRRRQKA